MHVITSMLHWIREVRGLYGWLGHLSKVVLWFMLNSRRASGDRVTSRNVDNAQWWLGSCTACWKARWSWESGHYMGWTRCDGDGRDSMLGPIQSCVYRWDSICNYLPAEMYEMGMTLQLIWEQTNGHYHGRLPVDQDHTGAIRMKIEFGSITEDVRVVVILKEKLYWEDSMVRPVTW